jgi:hypothetical protein
MIYHVLLTSLVNLITNKSRGVFFHNFFHLLQLKLVETLSFRHTSLVEMHNDDTCTHYKKDTRFPLGAEKQALAEMVKCICVWRVKWKCPSVNPNIFLFTFWNFSHTDYFSYYNNFIYICNRQEFRIDCVHALIYS